MEKTNVMRILEQKKIKYNEYFYGDTDAISGVDVARVLNEDPNKVFKTYLPKGIQDPSKMPTKSKKFESVGFRT